MNAAAFVPSPDQASPDVRHARSRSEIEDGHPVGLEHRTRLNSNQSLDRPSFKHRRVHGKALDLGLQSAIPEEGSTSPPTSQSPSSASRPDLDMMHPTVFRAAHKLSSINWIGSSPMFGHMPDLQDHMDSQPDISSAIPNGTFNSSSLLPLNNSPLALLDINSAYHAGSPASANQGKKRQGYYYVDGGGARLPRVKKRRLNVDAFEYPPLDIQSPGDFYFAIPHIPESSSAKPRVDFVTYTAITAAFRDHCIHNTLLQPCFEDTPFIPLNTMNHLIDLYIAHMHPLLPFLHLSSMDLNQCSWVLALAVATFGTHFLNDPQSRNLNIAMQEFLRRVLLTTHANLDKTSQSKFEELWLAQASLLSCLGGFFSGNARLHRNAYNARSALCAFCIESWALPDYIEEDRPEGHDDSIWLSWCFNESVRRTGYAIWLLDSMLAYEMDYSPLLSLAHAKVPLPCPEIMFDARNPREWLTLSRLATPMPSLIVACELLYTKKHINIITGEYSRVLLIHAIFQRTWDIERYIRQPLSHLVPISSISSSSPSSSSAAATRSAIPTTTSSPSTTPPSILPSASLHSAWLNAACAALNVLHWGANACVAAQSGTEHPTILHLHLAHIALLAPLPHLARLAYHIAGITPFRCPADEEHARAVVLDWIRGEDAQDRARLAVIRAGGIFWHVRRYSSSGFYEPAAVFHATLVLWAYSFFARPAHYHHHHPSHPSHHPAHPVQSPSSDTEESEVINLDRPLDDELASAFVRRGARMRAYLTGVGGLADEGSAARVVRRGAGLYNYRRREERRREEREGNVMI
ncbi:hypothetical protein EJ05DRAFT_536940 [Pseudovirgaria hyperparasitica]|uniref:Xylanolytic transcriptional activator regulatory domain-containing protein n=1 Tax=Pseudovirgaria hyperparasitica TaxID=470096 RepID=A0A6A6WAT4_9PEZI|nr:uncharacterized protein EJ05DRAFT_536940 [Pseudovirgaria hyperparasitica]KAF2759675.1 hypothetical protein EJ05DRAFT_536940 [Pseudovirgaria hyperparasitica]